jgi:hypothetical protein
MVSQCNYQILLKWQEDVVVPEHFSTDEVVVLKKWKRIHQGEHTGDEPVYYSAWNGQPTLRVTAVTKPEVFHVRVTRPRTLK